MMHHIAHMLFTLLFIVAAIDILYLLIASIAGHFTRERAHLAQNIKRKIAVLITSYKEDKVIVQTALRASLHNYPADSFGVYLAADQLHPDTLSALRKLNIHLFEVHFETGSKAKSLNALLNGINEKDYDIAVVLDGDNIMQEGFLEKINAAFSGGFKAAQGHRTAKNKNTPIAVLDAISEEINNHLFRKAQRALGFSSATIGSGMAFEFWKLREVYNKPGILDNPACDREVDFEMTKAGIVVGYLEDAYIFDEKVSQEKVYKNQRRRWMESQIIHLKLFFSAKERVRKKTRDYWNKLFINLIPPRIIFIGLFILVFFIFLLQHIFRFEVIRPGLILWIALLVSYTAAMLLSIPRNLYTLQALRAMVYLPVLLISLLSAAFSLNHRRKEFVHTPKSFRSE